MEKDLLPICSRCERIRINEQWLDRDIYSDYDFQVRTHNLTYGYCPECTEYYQKENKELKRMYGSLRN